MCTFGENSHLNVIWNGAREIYDDFILSSRGKRKSPRGSVLSLHTDLSDGLLRLGGKWSNEFTFVRNVSTKTMMVIALGYGKSLMSILLVLFIFAGCWEYWVRHIEQIAYFPPDDIVLSKKGNHCVWKTLFISPANPQLHTLIVHIYSILCRWGFLVFMGYHRNAIMNKMRSP